MGGQKNQTKTHEWYSFTLISKEMQKAATVGSYFTYIKGKDLKGLGIPRVVEKVEFEGHCWLGSIKWCYHLWENSVISWRVGEVHTYDLAIPLPIRSPKETFMCMNQKTYEDANSIISVNLCFHQSQKGIKKKKHKQETG